MKRQSLRPMIVGSLILNLVRCLLLAGGIGFSLLRKKIEESRRLKVRWRGEAVRFSAMGDGPFVITHLVRYGTGAADQSVAVLPEPLVFMESGGQELDAATVKRLVWRSARTHEKVSAPAPNTPIRALYYSTDRTPQEASPAP